ncbi:MAG TPA: DUF4410 domain-containing protein [Thermoanaerobaculia bacterium]|nr:DUF4410 domain-containing protein [Thermoanaerobaculia bacterium]
MKAPLRSLPLFALALLIASLPAAAAKEKKALTAPGTYIDWQDEIDDLEIIESFKLADYSRVVVEPFDTSNTPLPEEADNAYQPVRKVLADATSPFVTSLREELKGKVEVAEGEKGSAASIGAEEKTLVVRGRVTTMDPGSRAARYWAGFGAGAARTGIAAEVVDGATGKVLLRFQQERRSGVGAAGGSYENLLERNLRKIGEDAALILGAF